MASRAAMLGRSSWRAEYQPNTHDTTPEGAATRSKIAAVFDAEQRKITEIPGIEWARPVSPPRALPNRFRNLVRRSTNWRFLTGALAKSTGLIWYS